MAIVYRWDQPITVEQFRDLLIRSTLGERRPLGETDRLQGMLDHANLLCTAWEEGRLVGLARSLTDFAYCCYLSDLAVDVSQQGLGIGTELIRLTQSRLHPNCKVILLSAPKAETYYPKIGFSSHPSAWIAPASPPLPVRAGNQ